MSRPLTATGCFKDDATAVRSIASVPSGGATSSSAPPWSYDPAQTRKNLPQNPVKLSCKIASNSPAEQTGTDHAEHPSMGVGAARGRTPQTVPRAGCPRSQSSAASDGPASYASASRGVRGVCGSAAGSRDRPRNVVPPVPPVAPVPQVPPVAPVPPVPQVAPVAQVSPVPQVPQVAPVPPVPPVLSWAAARPEAAPPDGSAGREQGQTS